MVLGKSPALFFCMWISRYPKNIYCREISVSYLSICVSTQTSDAWEAVWAGARVALCPCHVVRDVECRDRQWTESKQPLQPGTDHKKEPSLFGDEKSTRFTHGFTCVTEREETKWAFWVSSFREAAKNGSFRNLPGMIDVNRNSIPCEGQSLWKVFRG